MRAAVLVAALVVACGSSSSSPSSGGGQMGAACTCPSQTDAGDFLCGGKGETSCAASLYCIDGICSTFCQLDAGTCPAGYVCRQTPHSNAAIYCAPQ
jgi:hypothetical protein